jgi:hypothetical protein
MARLPIPGGDESTWGQILNDFLGVSHASDGTLTSSAVTAAGAASDSAVVHNTGAEAIAGTKTFNASPVVPTPTLGSQAANKTYVDSVAGAGAPDATTTTKGILQLAGDLGGTASLPTVPGLANKQPLDSDLTAIAGLSPLDNDVLQRKAGAWTNRTPAQFKSDLALTKNDVGLANVPNVDATDRANHTGTQLANTISDFTSAAQGAVASDLASKASVVNGGGETYFDAGNSGAAITLNLANGNVQKLTLTANCTITLTSPAGGAMRSLTLLVFQDGVGSRTITWPGTVKWGNAGAPVLTLTAAKMDMVSLFTVDGGTNWYGALGAKGF